MPAFINKNGTAVEVFLGVAFVDRDAISRPSNWLELATPDELAAARIVEIAEPPAPPAGKVVVPGPLGVVDSVPTRSYTLEDAPAPQPDPVPDEVADWQFAAQAAIEGIITEDEAEAWAGRGIVPKTLADAVAAQIQDPDQLFEVRMLLAGAKAYQRNNPLVPLLGAVFRKDAAGLDQFWRDASTRGVLFSA